MFISPATFSRERNDINNEAIGFRLPHPDIEMIQFCHFNQQQHDTVLLKTGNKNLAKSHGVGSRDVFMRSVLILSEKARIIGQTGVIIET